MKQKPLLGFHFFTRGRENTNLHINIHDRSVTISCCAKWSEIDILNFLSQSVVWNLTRLSFKLFLFPQLLITFILSRRRSARWFINTLPAVDLFASLIVGVNRWRVRLFFLLQLSSVLFLSSIVSSSSANNLSHTSSLARTPLLITDNRA